MKVNSKGKFEVNYLFLKPISENFDSAWQSIMGQKDPNWLFLAPMLIEKGKSKVKGTLR